MLPDRGTTPGIGQSWRPACPGKAEQWPFLCLQLLMDTRTSICLGDTFPLHLCYVVIPFTIKKVSKGPNSTDMIVPDLPWVNKDGFMDGRHWDTLLRLLVRPALSVLSRQGRDLCVDTCNLLACHDAWHSSPELGPAERA